MLGILLILMIIIEGPTLHATDAGEGGHCVIFPVISLLSPSFERQCYNRLKYCLKEL